MYGVEAAINTGKQIYTMTGEDVVLSTFLTAQGAKTYKDTLIVIPDGGIVGGTVDDASALLIDDVSAYSNILIETEGDVQGMQGNDAIRTVVPITLINDGIITAVPDAASIIGGSNVTIHVKSTGSILSGGGNGGDGGKGANATYLTSIQGPQYRRTSPVYAWAGYSTTSWTTWNNAQLIKQDDHYRIAYYANIGDGWKWYYRGTYQAPNTWYSIYRGTPVNTTGGAGGAGGLGQGYLQDAEEGNIGDPGGTNAGAGGKGHDGGGWGESLEGERGTTGGLATYITEASLTQNRNGSLGAYGTAAGQSINLI